MVEVTLEITQTCPFGCPECSSTSTVEEKHLPFRKIVKVLAETKEDIERINISGGEPLIHPRIGDIILLCYGYTDDVRIYTNLIRHLLYNSHVIKGVKVEANVCVVPGRQIYIPTKEEADRVRLLKFIQQGRGKDIPDQDITVSRNFYEPERCDECNHLLLQADGRVRSAPCKKNCGVDN